MSGAAEVGGALLMAAFAFGPIWAVLHFMHLLGKAVPAVVAAAVGPPPAPVTAPPAPLPMSSIAQRRYEDVWLDLEQQTLTAQRRAARA